MFRFNSSISAGQSSILKTPHQVLQQVFGYSEFRGNQLDIVNALIAGNDALVLMPTGGGKSLCYQIPALLRDGMGLVVSPLIALMQDQVQALRQNGVNAAFLNSTLGVAEQRNIVDACQRGDIDLLYVAPERLSQAATRDQLSHCAVSLIAIDEAHCVSQWGHDFRRDYLSLGVLKEAFPGVPRVALTATATPETQRAIIENLALSQAQRFVQSFDRPNIRYGVSIKQNAKRQMLQVVNAHRGESGIVYCLSRKRTESMAKYLNEQGIEALPYHAGMPAEQRQRNQERFLREDAVVMVATIAFGMGIDKPDVRFVVHLNLPKSIESYYQETGRAGRDGELADVHMIYGLDDVVQLSQFIDNSASDEQFKRVEKNKLDALLGFCELTECRRTALLAYFGEQQPTETAQLPDGFPCCDNCESPPQMVDATEPAQKLLSTIYRTGQRFGLMHVLDVLEGRITDKVTKFGHDKLSTFGIGSGYSTAQWRSHVRQLLVQGYIAVDHQQFGAIRLSDKSRDLLKGAVRFSMHSDAVKPAREKSANKSAAFRQGRGNVDSVLWDSLREKRKQLAEEFNIAPYMVFHDATLMEMMECKPRTLEQLRTLNGVGAAKLEKFGQAFLDVVNS